MSPGKGNKELSKAAGRMRRKRDAESEADTKERQQKNAARAKLKRDPLIICVACVITKTSPNHLILPVITYTNLFVFYYM